MAPSPKGMPVNVYLPVELVAWLDAEAVRADRSRSGVVRRLVEAAAKASGKKKEGEG